MAAFLEKGRQFKKEIALVVMMLLPLVNGVSLWFCLFRKLVRPEDNRTKGVCVVLIIGISASPDHFI